MNEIEELAEIIGSETKGGYFQDWGESSMHLTGEQQADYFRWIARTIMRKGYRRMPEDDSVQFATDLNAIAEEAERRGMKKAISLYTSDTMTQQPDKKQAQGFWERCGGRFIPRERWFEPDWWRMPDGSLHEHMEIDLNNLFEYAVPKLVDEIGLVDTRKLLTEWSRRLTGDYMRDTSALFWTIRGVIKNDTE